MTDSNERSGLLLVNYGLKKFYRKGPKTSTNKFVIFCDEETASATASAPRLSANCDLLRIHVFLLLFFCYFLCKQLLRVFTFSQDKNRLKWRSGKVDGSKVRRQQLISVFCPTLTLSCQNLTRDSSIRVAPHVSFRKKRF